MPRGFFFFETARQWPRIKNRYPRWSVPASSRACWRTAAIRPGAVRDPGSSQVAVTVARPRSSRSEAPLSQPMPSTMSLVAAFFRTVAAPIARRRSLLVHENRVIVPLDEQPLKHPMVSRSLRTGWLQSPIFRALPPPSGTAIDATADRGLPWPHGSVTTMSVGSGW